MTDDVTNQGLIDLDSLFKIQYGMYVITSRDGDNLNGQITTTAMQLTCEPIKVMTCLSKNTLTHEMVKKSKIFGVCILDQNTPMKFIGHFGYRSGRDFNKFDNMAYELGPTGVPLVIENVITVLDAKVTDIFDVKTHTIFIGQVESAKNLKEGVAMTYEFYHTDLKGKSPKNAPTYRGYNKACAIISGTTCRPDIQKDSNKK